MLGFLFQMWSSLHIFQMSVDETNQSIVGQCGS